MQKQARDCTPFVFSFLLVACSGSVVETSDDESSGYISGSDRASHLDGVSRKKSKKTGLNSSGARVCVSNVLPRKGTVITDRGAVTGALEGQTYAYKNIPYAKPPVGVLRWRPPQPAACWEGERDATAWGPLCPQLDNDGKSVGEEDCLMLNVWTPAKKPVVPSPVLVWIHGGGHVQGGAPITKGAKGTRFFDGQRLVEKTGAIVVTLNYRLGALGYLAHEKLSAESKYQSSGNYGVLDQIAALSWVQRNAAAFDGDPDRVTIFGESAGAVGVCTLLASPLAKGLFSAAVMQSGACTSTSLSDAENFGAQVFSSTKCGAALNLSKCMRALPADKVITAIPVLPDAGGKTGPYKTVIDGRVLVDEPLAVIARGEHNHVPVIIGSNADETSLTIAPDIKTEADYKAALSNFLPGIKQIAKIVNQYPVTAFSSPRNAFIAVTTDVKFTCSARKTLRSLLQGQKKPVYRYFLTHAFDNGTPALEASGAWHGADILYLFDKFEVLPNYTPSTAERMLSGAFAGFWSRLAAAGDPNRKGAPLWPKYDATDPYLLFDSTITAKSGVRTENCDFWDSILRI